MTFIAHKSIADTEQTESVVNSEPHDKVGITTLATKQVTPRDKGFRYHPDISLSGYLSEGWAFQRYSVSIIIVIMIIIAARFSLPMV